MAAEKELQDSAAVSSDAGERAPHWFLRGLVMFLFVLFCVDAKYSMCGGDGVTKEWIDRRRVGRRRG